jgi:hypothetical protein
LKPVFSTGFLFGRKRVKAFCFQKLSAKKKKARRSPRLEFIFQMGDRDHEIIPPSPPKKIPHNCGIFYFSPDSALLTFNIFIHI